MYTKKLTQTGIYFRLKYSSDSYIKWLLAFCSYLAVTEMNNVINVSQDSSVTFWTLMLNCLIEFIQIISLASARRKHFACKQGQRFPIRTAGAYVEGRYKAVKYPSNAQKHICSSFQLYRMLSMLYQFYNSRNHAAVHIKNFFFSASVCLGSLEWINGYSFL